MISSVVVLVVVAVAVAVAVVAVTCISRTSRLNTVRPHADP